MDTVLHWSPAWGTGQPVTVIVPDRPITVITRSDSEYRGTTATAFAPPPLVVGYGMEVTLFAVEVLIEEKVSAIEHLPGQASRQLRPASPASTHDGPD
jgi:hypothetical protein